MLNNTAALILNTTLWLAMKGTSTPRPLANNLLNDWRKESELWLIPKNTSGGPVPCFGQLGCFPITYPWTNNQSRPVATFPETPDKVNPGFLLYTRKNPKEPQFLMYDQPETLYHSHLVPTHKVYFIAHGFLESGYKPWIKELTRALLRRSDCNVIVIDWYSGSSPPYAQAVANIRLVGAIGGHLVHSLHETLGVKTEFIHVIGHSLGAHLAGYIGNTILSKFNMKLGRISGLDPAEPHFSETDPVVRLDPSDATFVDIVHTDTTPFIQGGLGMDEPIGHLDFFPNGGATQPGCYEDMTDYVNKYNGSLMIAIKNFVGCDHIRSYKYFIESVHSRCKFMSIECDSWENFKAGNCFTCKNAKRPYGRTCAKMGKHSVRAAHEHGIIEGNVHTLDRRLVKLYTITGNSPPFCRSLYRITIAISNSEESQKHKGEIGEFSVELFGAKGNSQVIPVLGEQYFEPGSIRREVIGGPQVGKLKLAYVHWYHHTSINFLTWRIDTPFIYVQNITIDNLEEDSSMTFCPHETEKIFSGRYILVTPCSEETIIPE